MKNFNTFILEAGGQAAGKLELVKTKLDKARSFADDAMRDEDKELNKEIPDFDKNFLFAQKQAGTGKTQRKDMPVITSDDAKRFQKLLAFGFIDIKKPFNKDTKANNPFPDGLSGKQADEFLKHGLKKNDGDNEDDKVSLKKGSIKVSDLKPIQKQIFFDKSLLPIAQNGADNSEKFFTSKSNTFIISKDNFIIDGHHRYLGAILINPSMKVNALIIDLPIKELLPLSLAFGDAIGNKRNS